MSYPWHCRWCPYRAVVPSLVHDHEETCPCRPTSAPEERS